MTQVSTTVSTTNYTGYDAMGRVTASSQTTNGQTYLLGYGYNLAGGMTSETYPSGRVVNTNYDGAGRVNGVTGTGSRNYATSILYAPQGGMTSLALGNLLTESTAYNNRLQPTSISVGTLVSLGYAYGMNNNNGNVQSQTITASGLSLTQTYAYDWLNRLTGMNETSGWSETFSYDQYGNRTGGSSSSPYMPLQIPTINAQTNKISAANHSYDPVGNLTQGLGADQLVKTYTYDADNRLMTFNGSAAAYSYDGDGRRVKKVVGSATTVLVYDARGQMVAEYSNQAPTTSGGTTYVTADHLGSTRLVTDSTGTVISRHDYAPFGEEISSVIGGRSGVTGYGVDEGLRQKFTGKERDVETGLDWFETRYFESAQGRFTSPDQPFAGQHVEDPQSWNMYAYVRNNPLRYTDPDGRDCFQGVSSCLNYLAGGLKAIGNIPSDIVNAPNRIVDTVISPFTGFRFGDVVQPSFTPSNVDQQQGMQAANAVMLVAPVVGELGATSAAAEVSTEVPLVTQNAARGAASEARVLNDLGLTKNTESVVGAEGKSIPDFQTSTTIGEIKDVKQLSNTQQLRIQRDAAQQSGREHVVITGTKTNVPPSVQKPPTKVIRRDDLGANQ